ncbi:MFS transporter [Paenibacillus glucanolyticus]|jgi:DHA3 family macrolide efflux protein-like MFS transporter|uniref:MFS transporter n=1 Tax=Paenibacillus TaxID=44249 RepID=UPI0003E1F0EA|nr:MULTISPECIES: MFS transporter [Paenibacillus]ANA82730.1 MFS transporter [Paenibacillus glucanolyticus]AVV58187.1 MFS transporter [Paenibacillus glucanolyticus]ETT42943.1 major facilitator superfamily protein [Paenibacillus sp. FSL R5-808]MPY17736.1 MFS transporter [Paenibacillus glucanolyticus]
MLLNNPYVRTIILSHVLLNLGIWVRNFAILLYVTDITNNDPWFVSLISVAEFAPIFLFAFIGGTFADRWRPKRTMIGADVLSAVSVFLVLIAVHNNSWQALLVVTLFSAIMSQFSQPSAMKLFKQHVPEHQLQSVMAIFQSLMAFFMVIGPIAGAFVYQKFGIEASLIATGVLFLGSALILVWLPRDQEKESKSEQRSLLQEAIEGLRYVWNNRALRTLATTFAAAGLAAGLIQPMMLFVTIENLGQDKSFLQWLLTANGAAMLLGGGFVMVLAKRISPQSLLALGLTVSALGNLGIGWSTSILFTLLLQVVNGFFYPTIHIGINTLILTNTENAYIGRVGGALTPIFMGMMVIGMSLGGLLKNQFSLFTVFSASALLFLIGSALLIPLFKKSRNATNSLVQ